MLEMLEAEAGTAGRVDLDDARKPMPPGLSQAGMVFIAGRGLGGAAANAGPALPGVLGASGAGAGFAVAAVACAGAVWARRVVVSAAGAA